MENINLFKYTASSFTYESQVCTHLIDTNHDTAGNAIYTLKFKAKPKQYHKLAYSCTDGLVKIDYTNGTVIKNSSVMEDFASLNLKKLSQTPEGIIPFFEKYGFLLPIPEEEYYSISYSSLFFIINRLKALNSILLLLKFKKPNYNILLEECAFLLFSKVIEIPDINGNSIQISNINPINEILYRDTKVPIRNDTIIKKETFSVFINNQKVHEYMEDETDEELDKYVIVQDSLTKKEEYIHYISYLDKVTNQCTVSSNLLCFYCGINPSNIFAKKVIDFFYHLDKIAPIERFTDTYCTPVFKEETNLNKLSTFDTKFQDCLIDIAKLIIKEEFDFIFSNIHPIYDTASMSPSWVIPNLLTAMYFSLGYIGAENKIIRTCANPKCNKIFYVSNTNSKKKYHCKECQNAAAQQRYRQRKLQ